MEVYLTQSSRYSSTIKMIDEEEGYDNYSSMENTEKEYSQKLYSLGILYEKGSITLNGIPDYESAATCYEEAYRLGFIEGLCKLGNLFLNGYLISNIFRTRYEIAADLYNKAADCGSVTALCNLGILCEMKDTKSNIKQANYLSAKKYYEEASKKGSLHAMCNLGSLYVNGYITDNKKPDYEKAAEYFKQASDKGYPKAKKYLKILMKKCENNQSYMS